MRRFLMAALIIFWAVTAWPGERQLVSVPLESRGDIVRWKEAGFGARLFLEGRALVVADQQLAEAIRDRGFKTEVLAPWDEQGSYWVARNGLGPSRDLPGLVIWNKGKAAVIRQVSQKGLAVTDPHRYQPFPNRELPDQYWEQLLVPRVTPAALPVDPQIQSLVAQVSADTLTAVIQRMQDFRTRLALSDSCNAAEQWLRQKLTDYGYAAQFDSFYHARSLYFSEPWPGAGYDRNVIARKAGLYRPEQEYVICGHLDATTLGGYPHPIDTSICRTNAPGADDNASGSAATLEIARICSGIGFKPTVTYALWAAEESYLLGSAHYAYRAESLAADIRGVVNMDMVGWMNDAAIDIDLGSSDAFSQWLNDLYYQAALIYAPELTVYQGMGNASDDMSFADRGYPAVLLIADVYAGFNPYYHTTDETIDKINPLLYTATTKASLAVTLILGLYPGVVDSLRCMDLGDGSRLALRWKPGPDADITGYRVYFGRSSGSYSDTLWVPGLSTAADTVSGLWADTTYHFTITAVDGDGRESYTALEVTGTPRTAPLATSGLTATPVDSGIGLIWRNNLELDLEGYDVFRRINGGTFDSLASTTDTVLLDKPLSGANRYYYKVRARDTDSNVGPFSDSAYGRPITLDQGILLVDETNNWTTGSFPRDAQQDSFYNYMLSGYAITPYEYGTALQKPLLADFGPYSTVTWLGDDYTVLLASGAVNDLKSYLGAGGRLWFAGWKPSGDLRGSATYPADFGAGNILYDYLKISHAELSGTTDSFRTAIGLKGYPDIMIDTLKYPATIYGKTFRSIEALTPAGTGDTIYVMDMKNNSSIFEGRACAVRDSGRTVFFGFPVYFMDKEQARAAAQRVMAEFGEQPLGVNEGSGDKLRVTGDRLWQNSPNPFSRETTIRYQINTPGRVSLKIYNIQGQLVKVLYAGYQEAGHQYVSWDGTDDAGRPAANGIYICTLNIGGSSKMSKMTKLK